MIYVYRITNLINKKYYIGIHQNCQFDDDYMGSGRLIIRAIKKYGKENFIKEKLFEFETRQEAEKKEIELIDLSDPLIYNKHPGGKGGWDYVNSLNLPNCMKSPEIVQKMKQSRKITYENNKEYYDGISRSNIQKATEKRIGSKDTPETISKRASSVKNFYSKNVSILKDVPKSAEHKQALSMGWTEEKRRKKSDQQKQRIQNDPNIVKTNLGKKFSDETKARMAEARKQVWEVKSKIKSTCPHCGRTGTAINMKRWHFERCKRKI